MASIIIHKRFKALFYAVLLPGAAFFSLQQCNPKPNTTDEQSIIGHYDSARYVGIETCANCHADIAKTFLKTGMGSSFDRASIEKSSARFGPEHLVYDTANDLFYKPFFLGTKLYIREFRLKNGDTIHNRLEEIHYVIGSGHHTNSHLVKKGEYLVQAPMTFYTQQGHWDLPPGFEKGNNSRFTRIIDQECMTCHNAFPRMKNHSTREFATIPHGIDCERCHGPGSVHVNYMMNGQVELARNAIVNPSKLAWERQIDVCQRCHLQGNNVLVDGASFDDFKPGMKLSDVFEIYLPDYKGDASLFNMANHSERFQLSECFKNTQQNGGQAFTCISCHNPHVSVRETNHVVFNSTCISCHKSASSNFCSADAKLRQQSDDNCVQCHMPASGTEDIPHVTVHDHKVQIPSEVAHSHDGEIIGLRSVNNSTPSVKMQIKAYLTYFEKFDPNPLYRRKAEELLRSSGNSYPDQWVHFYYQVQNWEAIIKLANPIRDLDNIDGATAFRVGKAFSKLGKFDQACSWLKLSIQKSPDRFEYKNELAASLMSQEKNEEAEVCLEQCLNQFDEYLPALNNSFFLAIKQGKWTKAEKLFDQIVRLNPDYVPALENAVLMHQLKNDNVAVKKWLEAILSIDPNHVQAKEQLQRSYDQSQ